MTTVDAQKANAQAEAIQAATQAAIRAESGEFVFATRDEVSAFVNALPAEVKVRWFVETVIGGSRYRVLFWRSFWRGGGRKTSEPVASIDETSQP